MSDNIDVTPGSGKTVRTIEKNGKEVQVIQVDLGSETAEHLLVKGQAAAADSLPVVLASDQVLPLPTGAATEATLLEIKTGISTLSPNPAADHTTAESPEAVRLSDGAAFYKATSPADTQPVSIAEGLDAAGGTKNDPAVVTDGPGSRNAFLRGLVKIFADVWSSSLHALGVQGVAGGLPVATKGTGFSIPVTLTVTNGAYSVADVAGGLITLANLASANGKRSIIHTITLAGAAAIPYEMWFFKSDIATPAADNAVFTLAASDQARFLGAVPITTDLYTSAQNAFNFATVSHVGLEVQADAASTSIYAYLKTLVTTSPGTTSLNLVVSGEFLD